MNLNHLPTPLILLLLLVLALTTPAPAQPVPDTGVTLCYDNAVEIPCPAPGQDFYGQDASYTINPMSYTKLDASGNDLPESATSWAMVRDNVTGLIWEVKTEANQNDTYTWDAAHTYAASLRLGGFSDWRLPTIKELQYLVDFSIPWPGPAIDTIYFPNTASSWYWSSSTDANSTSYAWVVVFSYGDDSNHQ